LKILTLNLRHNEDRWEDRLPLVVDALQTEQAEVIGFQEVWLGFQQAHLIADRLNKQTPERPYSVFVEPKWGENPVEGIGLLSRLPVIEHQRLELPEGERIAQSIRVEIDGKTVDIANTHLHHRPEKDEIIRLPQMETLLKWMFEQENRRWILTGDMNAIPTSTTIKLAKKRLSSAYEAMHKREPVTTFPTPLVTSEYAGLSIAIDYVFFDPSVLRVKDAQVIANQPHPDDRLLYPSDHYGLTAELEII
jgi:endonuclease/exonuclease/phosphatase family metal-dependent hydrolase